MFSKTHVLQKWLLYTIHMSGEILLPLALTLIRCTSRNTQSEFSLIDLKWKRMNLKILSFFLKHPVVTLFSDSFPFDIDTLFKLS